MIIRDIQRIFMNREATGVVDGNAGSIQKRNAGIVRQGVIGGVPVIDVEVRLIAVGEVEFAVRGVVGEASDVGRAGEGNGGDVAEGLGVVKIEGVGEFLADEEGIAGIVDLDVDGIIMS